MPSRDFKPITVAGHKLTWTVRHWPQWTSVRGLVGLSVEVIPIEPSRQRLIIHFPSGGVHSHRMSPQRVRPKVSSEQVADIARSALDAGWAPDSRGKPFIFEVQASNFRWSGPWRVRC